MRILVIGGNGTIGKRVVDRLREKHEVVIGGRSAGDVKVDLTDSDSIHTLFQRSGKWDGIVCIAGEAAWKPLAVLSADDYWIGLRSKLMGQVNLVRIGAGYLYDRGSFTLTSGILAEDPVAGTASAALVNGAIHGFVKAAALEMDRGMRINVVAPGLVEDSYQKYGEFFPGRNPVPMAKVVNGYIRSIEGKGNGEIIRIYE